MRTDTNRTFGISLASNLRDMARRGEVKLANLMRERAEADVRVLPITGFHLYLRLKLKLDLEAADEEAVIRRYLQVISRYASIADDAADDEKSQLLEVQGEIVHVFLPSSLNGDGLETLFAYCVALRDQIEAEVKPLAGDDWVSLRMAVDHGNTLLLDSALNVDDSMISLAPAANSPAKQFRKNSTEFPANHLRMPARLCLTGVFDGSLESVRGSSSAMWISVSIDRLREILAAAVEGKGAEIMQKIAGRIEAGLVKRGAIDFSNATLSRDISESATLEQPARLRGWVLRADLDGFSNQVETAFNGGGEAAIRVLVEKFIDHMQEGEEFDNGSPWTVVPLPWAGDCASRIVMGGNYERDASSLPAKASLRWHNITDSKRWLTSIAGGDDTEGNGYLLVCQIAIDGKCFRVTGGWPAKRSRQGEQEVSGVPTESIMHSLDVRQLGKSWRDAFREIDGCDQFMKAGLHDLNSVKESAPYLPPRPILSPKPYAC